jgi:hypothetical protein
LKANAVSLAGFEAALHTRLRTDCTPAPCFSVGHRFAEILQHLTGGAVEIDQHEVTCAAAAPMSASQVRPSTGGALA